MMDTKRILEESSRYVMNTYKRFPISLRKGNGIKVWSSDDKEYLDFLAGIAVNVVGHCHPKVMAAVANQIALRNGLPRTDARAIAAKTSSVVLRSLKKLSSVPKKSLIPASSASPVISSTSRAALR